MKLIKNLKVLILFAYCTNAFAQEQNPKPINRVIIHDLYVQTGSALDFNANSSLADFKTLAPNSSLLKNDMTGFSGNNGINLSYTEVTSVLVGIKFSDKEKKKYKADPMLRLGLSYQSGNGISNYLSKQVSAPYDTLISSRTGASTYIDTVNYQMYNMDYNYDQLRIDGSLIFRLKPEERWSLFAGVGLSAGFSVNASTKISYSNSSNVGTWSRNDPTFNRESTYSDEVHLNKTNFGITAYVPLGVDFRIGKKREFWKQIHLVYELKPAITYFSVPELRSFTAVGAMNSLGVRVAWN